MALENIIINEEDQEELKELFESYKNKIRFEVEQNLLKKYEDLEMTLREETEDLINETKENLKKVYKARFREALKEMYEKLRTEILLEQKSSTEMKILEQIKSIVFPLINEGDISKYRNEFEKLAEMYTNALEENALLKGEIKKKQILENLSPEVRKVVDKLLGEGTEEEIIEKFMTIKDSIDLTEQEMNEENNNDIESEEEDVSEPSYTYEELEDDEVENNLPEFNNEDNTSDDINESEEIDDEFKKILNEQLRLAGVIKD